MKIDSITPTSALPGTPLLIKGDLDTASKLLFGNESVPFKVSGTGSIEADVPSGSGTVGTGHVGDVNVSCKSRPAKRAFVGTFSLSVIPGFQSWPVDAAGAPFVSSMVTIPTR